MKLTSQIVEKEQWVPLAEKILAVCIECTDGQDIDILRASSTIIAALKAVEETVKMYLKSEGAEFIGASTGSRGDA